MTSERETRIRRVIRGLSHNLDSCLPYDHRRAHEDNAIAELRALLAAPSPSEERAEPDNPCGDALDRLWREIILARKPNYGDWEYPGMAYRHLLAEFNDLRTALHDAIRRPLGVVPDSAAKFYDPARALAPASPSLDDAGTETARNWLRQRALAVSQEAASPSVEPPRNNAWLALKHSSNLKQCPWCGELALEGEGECSECGARPTDDMTWRNARAPLVQPEPQPEEQG